MAPLIGQAVRGREIDFDQTGEPIFEGHFLFPEDHFIEARVLPIGDGKLGKVDEG